MLINKFLAGFMGLAFLAMAADVRAEGSSWGTSTNTTLINARSMNFDYQKHIATFQGDVVVADPTIKIMADTMRVDFTDENSPKVITADGRVKIWQGDRIAVSKTAIYTVASGELVLTGQPVLTRGQDRMAGTRIIFYRDDDRVKVDNLTMSIVPTKTNETRNVKE
jgi:lipopolysaccharide export system protein LptA